MDIHRPYLSSGAKPLFWRGSRVGCLCLHGFSAAPTEISWLGEHLHRTSGMTVYVPRLAGHGVDAEHMRRMRWQDWYLSARDGYELLRNQCDVVFVAGISMGGLLALMLAAAADTDIRGAAIIAAPTHFVSQDIYLTPFIKYVQPMRPMPDITNLPEVVRAEQARRGEPVIGRTHYAVWSMAATAELVTLAAEVREQLRNIHSPLTLIYAAQDGAVPLSCRTYIAQHVKSTWIEQHVLPESSHIVTQDIEREKSFAIVQDFFARVVPSESH